MVKQEDLINIFDKLLTCSYRGEVYQVRDNGLILRCVKKGHRKHRPFRVNNL